MRKFLWAIPFFLCHYVSFSQASIRGKVIDKQRQEGLAGATVSVKGQINSVIADNEGNFLLNKVKTGKTIVVISCIGYESLQIPVNINDNETFLGDVYLSPDVRIGSTVVVTATKRPEKIVNAPASISVFGVKDFDQFAGSNVNEMVSKVNGIQTFRSGVDWISFNARNFNSGGNQKVLQFVDGRLNKAALSANIPLFNMGSYIKDDLERMEVVLGPQAALYGPNALNAVFNMITKDPRKYQGTTVALSAGNHLQFSSRLRHAQRINNKWAYKINGEYASGRDYNWYDSVYVTKYPPYDSSTKEHNVDFDFRHIRAEAHVYYSIAPTTDIVVSGGFGNNNLLQPGRVQIRDVTHGFYQARLVHPHYFVTLSNTFGNLGKTYLITPYTTTFWNLTHKANPLPPEIAEKMALVTANEKSGRINADAQYNYSFQNLGLFLVSGLNYQLERPNGHGSNLLDSFHRISITQYGAVAQVEKSLPWNLRFIGALRYDHHSNFGGFFSPKLEIMKSLGDHNFRITWGNAFATPNILAQYQNIGGVAFGNAEGIIYMPIGADSSGAPENYKVTDPTKPEEIRSWEFGYKGLIAKKFFVDLTGYYNISKNYLGTVSVSGRAISAAGQTLRPARPGFFDSSKKLQNASFSYSGNYGQVNHYGLDVTMSYSFNQSISLTIQYSWFRSGITDSTLKNDANHDGYVSLEERSLNAPIHKGIIGVNIQDLFHKKLFINFATRLVQQYDAYSGAAIGTEAGKGTRGKVWVGSRYIYKNFDWGPLGGFISFDLNAGYRINEMLSVNMGITNLLNTRQMEGLGSPSIGRLIMFEMKVHVPNQK